MNLNSICYKEFLMCELVFTDILLLHKIIISFTMNIKYNRNTLYCDIYYTILLSQF